MNPQALIDALREVQREDQTFVLLRNQVGNLAIIDAAGEYVGFIDLSDGTVTWLRGER